jgi:DNA-binding beta-propeller fold protein YncE
MVTAIEATTGDVLATVPVGTRPVAVVAPGGSARISVTDEESDTVSIVDQGDDDAGRSNITSDDEAGVVGVDPASGNVVRRYRLRGGGTTSEVTFDAK